MYNGRFVADVTIPDDSHITPGSSFVKTWRIHNSGSLAWQAGSQIKFVHGNPMTTQTSQTIPAALPGSSVDISIPLTAPNQAGTYFSDWRLTDRLGNIFGELVYVRIVVPYDAAPAAPADTGGQTAVFPFQPAAWRQTIWGITSVFESGRAAGNPAAYQTYDAGIISYGKHQATLASGTLGQVVDAFLARSNSPTAQAIRHQYRDRIARHDASLRHDPQIKQLLLAAGQETAMNEAQDEVFGQKYYQPVIKLAQQYNVTTPLGLAVMYDTYIQGGLHQRLLNTSEQLGGKIGKLGRQGTISEAGWIATFLAARRAFLLRLSERYAAKGDSANANALRISTFRVDELEKLLTSNNLGLEEPLRVRNQPVVALRHEQTAVLA